MQSIEEYRRESGIESITSTCLKAANISAILIDDGIEMDKRNEIKWHKNFTFVGRILRTERVAEQILEQVRYHYTFTFNVDSHIIISITLFFILLVLAV